MTFHQPSVWLFLLLLALPIIAWRNRGGRRRSAVTFSSIGPLMAVGASWAVATRWVVPALRWAAVIVLIVCFARPQKANEHTRVLTEGIAIQLVIDRSGSMLAEDFGDERRRVSRLATVKAVVREFVAGGDELQGRPDDLIGLITFATYADSMTPLTLDHDFLLDAVAVTEVSPSNEDRATALGDAIALGVERIAGLEKGRPEIDRRIKSRIMVVLTDGENNAGDIDPITAAKMAAAFDIKVYTIGAGSDAGFALVPVKDSFTGKLVRRRIPVSIDERTLREIADITGGRYFRATDHVTLQEVYKQIDELERTRIEQRRYTDYGEFAVEPIRLAGVTVPPLLTVVVVLLGLSLVLANTRVRTLP